LTVSPYHWIPPAILTNRPPLLYQYPYRQIPKPFSLHRTKIFFPLLALLLLGAACTPQVQRRFLSADELGVRPQSFELAAEPRSPSRGPCYEQDNYRLDTLHPDYSPMRYLRINIHWMNSADSSQNVPEAVATAYAQRLVFAMNYALGKNNKMWLPVDNTTPVQPILFRYVLTGRPGDPTDDGIYYHYDDELYYYVHYRKKDSNLYSRDVFDKYAVQQDTVMNMFLMPHQPDSVASRTYQAGPVGVALRNCLKVAAQWKEDYAANRESYWNYRGVINHEVGHLLNLGHAWTGSDGCADTPVHKNPCWSRDAGPGCDTLTSNNVMDYNSLQLAWTPDQLARVYQCFANESNLQRKFLEPRWCERDPAADITIRDTVDWSCMRDLYGNLTIAPGGQLTIRCRTSVPAGGKITIQPGGTLILAGGRLHQACGGTWQGIEVEKVNDLEGRLELRDNASVADTNRL